MHIKDIFDSSVIQIHTQADLLPDDEFKRGYQTALDTLLKHLDLQLEVEELDEILDWKHDAVFWFQDNRVYRLDTVSEPGKPFVTPVVAGFGGKKRYVQGTQLNGLLPGVMLCAPNRRKK